MKEPLSSSDPAALFQNICNRSLKAAYQRYVDTLIAATQNVARKLKRRSVLRS